MNEPRHRDRHLDPDATGSPLHLLPGLAAPGRVTVWIGLSDAATQRGQLLVWATANLLLRCYGVLSTVTVRCPDVALTAELPHLSPGAPAITLHQALHDLAAATADPNGRGPQLHVAPETSSSVDAAGGVNLVLGSAYAATLAEDAGSTSAEATWLVTAGAWKLTVATPAALARIDTGCLPRLDERGSVGVAAWLAAAIGCAEAFKNVGQLRKGRGRTIDAFSANLWTLTGSDGFAELDTADGPAEPPCVPAHYVVGAGAVAEAYLASLATSDVDTDILVLDHDVLGDTNLNRHILAAWADLDRPKAHVAQARLATPRTRIFPAQIRWQDYVATPPSERPTRPQALAAVESSGQYRLVISAVDRDDSRTAIAAARPDVVLGGSTNGLAVEVGRYRAGSRWQCLACASRPRPSMTIDQATTELAGKSSEELATIAAERGLDLTTLVEYLGRPTCGALGVREVQHYAAFSRPDWSVSFVSVAAGALLAARVLTHVAGHEPEGASAEGDTLRLWLTNVTMARSAHLRSPRCAVCGPLMT